MLKKLLYKSDLMQLDFLTVIKIQAQITEKQQQQQQSFLECLVYYHCYTDIEHHV